MTRPVPQGALEAACLGQDDDCFLQDIARSSSTSKYDSLHLLNSAAATRRLPADIALHVDLWLIDRRRQTLRWIHDAGGTDLTLDDLDLVAELLLAECARS